MATTLDFIEYVCGQISGAGYVRYRKMFGEYMVYVNDKPVLLVCDNTVYVKMLPCMDGLLADAAQGYPYDGAKQHYVLDIDNQDLSREVATALERITPFPNQKRGRAELPLS